MSATALQRGQKRCQQERRREAIRRVRAFNAWKAHGFDRDHAPAKRGIPMPSDTDFRIAREAQR